MRRLRQYNPNVLLSFLPEEFLVEDRDIDPLWYKYRSQFPGGSRREALFKDWEAADLEWDKPYVRQPVFGSIAVHTDERSGVTAHNALHSVAIDSSNVNIIHADRFAGAQQFRNDMARAAAFVSENEELAKRGLVLGVTYRELASLVVRMGFERMEIDEIDEEGYYDIEASHMVFCALNGITRPFEVQAVCIPTEEFPRAFPLAA